MQKMHILLYFDRDISSKITRHDNYDISLVFEVNLQMHNMYAETVAKML